MLSEFHVAFSKLVCLQETITFSSSSFFENLNIIECDDTGRIDYEHRQSVYDIYSKTCLDFLPNNECYNSSNSQEESPMVEGARGIYLTIQIGLRFMEPNKNWRTSKANRIGRKQCGF